MPRIIHATIQFYSCAMLPAGCGSSAIAAVRGRCGDRQLRRQGQGDSAHGQPHRQVPGDFQHQLRQQGQGDSVHDQPHRQVLGDFQRQPRQQGQGDSVLFYLP